MSTFLLYRLVNKVNAKAYIGITSRSLHERWLEHKSDALSNKSDQPIHRAIRKYGADNFTMELLETAESWEALCQREIEEIALHKSERHLYNATWGGEGTLGIDRTYATGDNAWRRRTEEGRNHMRGDKSHMKRPEHRERMRTNNPAQRAGVMDCIKGDLNPAKRADVREKLRANNVYKNPLKSEEARRKLSEAKKKIPPTWLHGENNIRKRPEERERISGAGNPNAKRPLIHGVAYGTLQEAATALGVAQATTIRKRIDRGLPGYGWADQQDELEVSTIECVSTGEQLTLL